MDLLFLFTVIILGSIIYVVYLISQKEISALKDRLVKLEEKKEPITAPLSSATYKEPPSLEELYPIEFRKPIDPTVFRHNLEVYGLLTTTDGARPYILSYKEAKKIVYRLVIQGYECYVAFDLKSNNAENSFYDNVILFVPTDVCNLTCDTRVISEFNQILNSSKKPFFTLKFDELENTWTASPHTMDDTIPPLGDNWVTTPDPMAEYSRYVDYLPNYAVVSSLSAAKELHRVLPLTENIVVVATGDLVSRITSSVEAATKDKSAKVIVITNQLPKPQIRRDIIARRQGDTSRPV